MMTILIGFQNQNFHAEVARAPALSQRHCEEERVVSADLGGILGEVLCKDVAGWVLERPQRLGAPRTLASSARWDALQSCHVLVNRGACKRHFRLSGGSASERALLSKGRPLLHETLLLGSRNALRTTEHAETRKIAIWRPRPGDPLTMSHFGAPAAFDDAWGGPFSEGASGPDFPSPGRKRPSGAVERGNRGLSTLSEVPSVTPVRGEGKFEGEGGVSAPPSPSRQKWLPRGLPGSLEAADMQKPRKSRFGGLVLGTPSR